MAGARGERRVLVLGSDGRVWTNVARGGAWGGWSPVGARRFASGANLAALGDHESEHRAFVLEVDGRVWTNVARSVDARWEGWCVLGESAFPA